ncbi:HMA2 domain-containing protein [Floridanema evergladense]|uniref:HMA2 domain-containing protein n=1 Tax=Floridaenema evergladense BLCC-F167 TaxID=3153639 RepID=A0ABV4WM09_9CYAN
MPVMTKEVQEGLSFQVVHSIPGRIRIRISHLLDNPEYANKLKQLIEALDLVTHVRFNPAANSLVVEYRIKGDRNSEEIIKEQIFQAINPTKNLQNQVEESTQIEQLTQVEEVTEEELATKINPGVGPRHHLKRN